MVVHATHIHVHVQCMYMQHTVCTSCTLDGTHAHMHTCTCVVVLSMNKHTCTRTLCNTHERVHTSSILVKDLHAHAHMFHYASFEDVFHTSHMLELL